MFLNFIESFVPAQRIGNEYFASMSGLDESWYTKRTGIRTRSRASKDETMNVMCREAVKKAINNLPYSIQEIDTIVFASYTPADTIGTTGHFIQKEFGIENAKVFYISSACSSAVNAIEIINSFFISGLSKKALLICADRNSTYVDDTDDQNGHLWGDAAVSLFFSKEQLGSSLKLVDITTRGLGHIGKGIEGVYLNMKEGKLSMPYGKDVFLHACNYMHDSTIDILKKNGYSINDLDFFIGHQANMRILTHVADTLGLPPDKMLSNLEKYGNTGCAGAFVALAENYGRIKADDLIGISVFGGGYSSGACLFKKVD